MNFSFLLFIILSPISSIGLVAALMILLPYRKDPAIKALIYYLNLVIWLLLTNIAELIALPGPQTVFFAKLEYIGFLYIPVAWISFCTRYTGWVKEKKNVLSIPALIVATVLFVLVATNDLHGLVWQEIRFIQSGSFSVLRPVYGPLFWVIALYVWGTLFAGALLVFISFIIGQRLYYRQSLWILLGVLIPGMVNVLNIFRLIPGLQKDFTPLGFALSGFCFLSGIYAHQLFWIKPIARGAVVEELKQGVIVLDDSGWIVDYNRSATFLLDLEPVFIGLQSKNIPALMELFDISSFSSGKPVESIPSGQFEWNGRTLGYSFTKVERVSPIGVVIVLEDISEQMEIKTQLRQLKQEFINRERLAEMGRVAAGLAHEIRNPLAYINSDFRSLVKIMGKLNGIPDTVNVQELGTIVEGIREGIDRIEHVVDSLLAFSRHGKSDTPFMLYDLHEGIDMTLLLMQSESRPVCTIQKKYGTVPLIWAQKNAINQVLFNILTNAIDAIKSKSKSDRKKGLITITTGVLENSIFCEISNNGLPLTLEEQESLFHPFFSTKPDDRGFGLGLNLSREIIEQNHHGKLEFVSADPVTFRILLPVQKKPVQ